MGIDIKMSVSFFVGALVVFLYWKWCESKQMKG